MERCDDVAEVMAARGEGLQSCDGLRRRRGPMMEMVVRILPVPSLLSIISLCILPIFILLAVNLNSIRVLIACWAEFWSSMSCLRILFLCYFVSCDCVYAECLF